MIWSMLLGTAFAQSETPPESRPLAIPATPSPGVPRKFDSILAFRDEHLSVRQVRRFVPGSATLVSSGWGYGPRPYWGWGWRGATVVTVAPPLVDQRWAVFEGNQRLTVPAYLDVTGQVDLKQDLTKRIDRRRRSATALQAVGWIGVIGGLATTVIATTADDFDDFRTLRIAGLTAAGLGSISILVGGGQRARARDLTTDFDLTLSFNEAQQGVRDYNSELMERLDLTPEEALRELDRSRGRSRR